MGGIGILNSMVFYQEQGFNRGNPNAVNPNDPGHQEWLQAFKSSRRVFGNEIRSCIVNDRGDNFTQNGGLWTGSERIRVQSHGLDPRPASL